MSGKIYLGDVGTEILVDLIEDISMATEHIFLVKKPDFQIVEWPAIIYESKFLKYVCQVGDLDQKGKYRIQPKISVTGWSGKGETVSFIVHDRFG